jgi:hydroxymethyl cephem carbamoyltransferase
MRILSFKPGHDGTVAALQDGRLAFSLEAEKDSGLRYSQMDAAFLVDVMQREPNLPDVLALSGWAIGASPDGRPVGAGYLGIQKPSCQPISLFGASASLVTSSHERSHVLCAYGMSPYAQGTPCYALVWEGYIGAFYEIDEAVNLRRLADIMIAPGRRYAFAYSLADPSFDMPAGRVRLGDAGKVMALASYEPDTIRPTHQESLILTSLLGNPSVQPSLNKHQFKDFEVYNSGVESAAAKRLSRLISDGLFNHFHAAISPLVKDKRPLLIAGGCGLNCDWNQAWEDSGLFDGVFVPPCANDTGSAIGTAVDAQLLLSGHAKIEWDVYSGPDFVDDMGAHSRNELGDFHFSTDDPDQIAAYLASGRVLGWVSGRTEIGPRALGHRSILASPFEAETLHRLNRIKQREGFRPIAPICLEEEAARHFTLSRPSPYMLFFSRVISTRLRAITHVDGSARVQTLNEAQCPGLYALLKAFKKKTDFGVLCNTSLNFKGKGFINRSSDLLEFASNAGLDGFVIEGRAFILTKGHA